MNATEELRACTSHAYASRFFLKIGQAGRTSEPRDTETLPLFSFMDFMRCEGLLASDYAYLARCEALIRDAAREMRA